MSETGLYSAQYEHIHDWAEIVDQMLIDLKSGSRPSVQNAGQKLGQLLMDIAQKAYNNPSTRFMVLHLQDTIDLSENELLKVGSALISMEYDDNIIALLEQFAQILEHEQLGAMSRMQRWTR